MSNEIQAKSSHSGDLELDIYVEADVETFTWAVVNAEGFLVAARNMERRPKDAQVPLGQDFKVTVKDEDFREFHASIGRDPDGFGGFPDGDYQVHLYEGRPSTAKTVRSVQAAFSVLGEPVADDAFAIRDRKFSSDRDLPGTDGNILTVALGRENPHRPYEPSVHLTYNGFVTFLSTRSAPDSYGDLRRAAREFVHSFPRVTQFAELLPEGYVGGRIKQFPGVPEGAGLPRLELIWNYWLEEGMLVQTLNVILARFQNRRLPGHNPINRFDVAPLLEQRSELWDFVGDELHRLTMRRRAAEYEYEYGFPLIGRAVPRASSLVERRDGFLSSFHQVLFLSHRLFKEQDDLTVQPDAFPLYRALRDCHIVLSQGSHNQYGEMAVAARIEFLVMQSILAEPQMREFLGGRPMTPYPEAWMDRVDTMKSIQGWTDTSIMHFNDLAEIGEQLVLTIRLGNWADPAVGRTDADNWSQVFRNSIQKYAAAYRAATGVDLAEEANTEVPSTLLARRLSGARARA